MKPGRIKGVSRTTDFKLYHYPAAHARECPMAIRPLPEVIPLPDFAIHCTAGIIGEAGSALSRTRAKRASGKGARRKSGELWLAPAKPVLRILDKTGPLAKLAA
jgi:hypothetical protein